MSQDSISVSAPTAAPGPKDGLFFLTILMNMKNKPEVDWNLVAAEAGFKNAKVASTRFGQMKKKFTGDSNSTSVSAQSTPNASFTSTTTVANTPTPSPTKRVKKEVGSGTNVSSGRAKKTPVKGNGMVRGMGGGLGGKKRVRMGEENEDVDGDVVDVFVGGGGKWEDDEYVCEI